MNVPAALNRKSKRDASQSEAKAGTTPDGAAPVSPAYLGGVAAGSSAPAFLQRLPHDPFPSEDEEELELQRLPQDPVPQTEDGPPPVLQAKLTINTPGDAQEAQADQVASNVIARKETGGGQIQRKCAACGAEKEGDSPCPSCAAKGAALQRSSGSANVPKPTASAAQAVSNPGSGAQIPDATRAPIEAELGRDLSGVRVHSDTKAREAADSIDAKAFTHGQNIWLGSGQSANDLGLMAHEATHTAQQGDGGASGPTLLQRAPADHRPTEDGAAPQARIDGELEKEKKSRGTKDPDDTPPKIDPGEKRAKAAPMESKAKPDTDRPAQTGPKVSSVAQEVKANADSPPEPLTPGKSDEPKADAAKGQDAPPDPAASVKAATAAVASLADPPPPDPVTPPPMVMPVDGDGLPLAPDLEGEALAQMVAVQLHGNRDAAFSLRQRAKQSRANAQLLRGNIGMADVHIAEAESGITKAKADLQTRRGVIKEAENAHAVSKAKAEKVGSEAPGLQTEAEGAQDEVGPIASEAADSAAQQNANKPDDPDAGGSAQENSQKLNSVASDTATMDQAAGQARARAVTLQADAAKATQDNAAAMGKIEESKASADQLDSKLDQEAATTTKAKAKLETQRAKPDAAEGKAQALDSDAAAVDATTVSRLAELQVIQADYIRDTAAVDGAQTTADANDGDIQRAPRSGGGRGGFFGMTTSGAGRVSSRNRGKPPRAAKGAKGQKPDPNQGYNDRWQVNIPQFNLMTDRQKQHRAQQAQAAADRRKARLKALQDGTYGDFNKLTAVDKSRLAVEFMLTEAYHSVFGVQWSDFSAGSAGLALLNALNPLGPINGVLSGLSTLASGIANIGNVEQWKKDPVQNALKVAADIATGITIVLGSIVALLGIITAITAAIIVLSWFTLLAPLTPIITWCTGTGITVGSWTISAGKFALAFQALLVLKNLYDAATAQNAQDLLQNSEQMSTDFAQAGQVGMQMGTAYLAGKGGPGMLDDIGANGARAVVQQEAKEVVLGAGLEYTFGADVAGYIGQGRMAKGIYGGVRGGGGDDGGGAAAPKSDGGDGGGGGGTPPAAKPQGGGDGDGGAPPAATAPAPKPADPPAHVADVPPAPNKPAPVANSDVPAPAGGTKPVLVDAPDPSPKVDLGDTPDAPVTSPAPKPATDDGADTKASGDAPLSGPAAADGGTGAQKPALDTQAAPDTPGPAPTAATGYKSGADLSLPKRGSDDGDAPAPTADPAAAKLPSASSGDPATAPAPSAPKPAADPAGDAGTAATPRPTSDADTPARPAGAPDATPGSKPSPDGDVAPPRPQADGDAPTPRPEPDASKTDPGTDQPTTTPKPTDPGQAELRQSAAKKSLAGMSDGERVAEAAQARAVPNEDVQTPALREEGFTDLRRLDNSVDYVGNPKKGKFCRVIQRCGSADATGNVPATGLKPDGDAAAQARVDAAATGTKPPAGTDPAPNTTPNPGDAAPAKSAVDPNATPAKPATDADAAAPPAKPAPDPQLKGEALNDNIKQSMHGEPLDAAAETALTRFGYTVSNRGGKKVVERRSGTTETLPKITVEGGRIFVDHYVKGSVNRTGMRINAEGKMEAIANLKEYRRSPDTVEPIWRPVDKLVPDGGDPNHFNWIKGQAGEIRMDKIAEEQGWIKVTGPVKEDGTRADADWLTPMPGANSIDAIYLNPNPPPGPYIVADAKVGSAGQGTTSAGVVQMSMQWILPRLESAGLSAADLAAIKGNYTPVLVKIDARGDYTVVILNADGSKKSTITLKGGTTDQETPA